MIPRAQGRAALPARDAAAAEFAADVRHFLSQDPRQLPSRYLYDALGSALFDAICELPWYRVTRAEMRLLREHGSGIWSAVPAIDRVIELGAGDGRKLTALIQARPRGSPPARVHLVDVSSTALASAASALARVPGTEVVMHQATYEPGLERATGGGLRGPALVLFLGSNIGNFDPPARDALLRHVRRCLRPGDALLLGADLVKPEHELRLAYDDPLGVTGAFNRNLLVRINRELGADFDVEGFAHRATWSDRESRVEMHLESLRRQRVSIPAAGLAIDLAPGERIWTESSYKFRPGDVGRMLERAGFAGVRTWTEGAAGFALCLSEVPRGAQNR